ncbi:SAM-dependent methyltransferase [Candidatus Scalindua japonica]|uniref:SAM-dependent methyltransferase n=1 Tax=Candidatus Scalindua japonica TaxID=1284222 RepID=A0A286U4C7_9BACT|nr:methyltransferase domain-containing protein [Candidatus Scalindua japonica]GAX62987.1 SAM-dependent methyltransferase [Candidatus Scalindua japonica]
MKRLTKINHWDNVHTDNKNHFLQNIGDKLNETKYFKSYTFSAFDRLCRKYLPNLFNLKILEVGSAPGRRLLYMHKIFEYEPYGVEYSADGVNSNKEYFRKNNLNPNNVIHADFFDPAFQNSYKSSFNIVSSFGFIEHFDDPSRAVKYHLNLLKKSGLILITVPNLRGLNYYVQTILNKSVIKKHNLEIMELQRFRSLFMMESIDEVYCDYYGTYNFATFNVKPGSIMVYVKYILLCLQMVLNPLMHVFLRNRGLDSPLWSPYLIFIGKKK